MNGENKFTHVKNSLAVALVTLIFSIMLIPACSAAVTIKEGDWAKYKIEANLPEIAGGGNSPFDDVEWLKFEVKSVSDSAITLEGTIRYKNGTETKETIDGLESHLIVDTENAGSEGNATLPTAELFGAFLPRALEGTQNTVSREYAGVTREVLHSGISMEESDVSFAMNFYWDKTTGMLCELSMSTVTPEQTASMSAKMTETNMWGTAPASEESSEQGLWILAVAGIIAAAAVAGSAVLLWRRKRRLSTEATSTLDE